MNDNSAARKQRMASIANYAGGATVLRGLLALAFGIIAIRSPAVAAAAFVVVFAIYAFADGVLDLVLAAQLGRAGHRWGWYLFEGLVSVGLGAIALAYPRATLLTIVVLVGLRAIILGVFEMATAFSWKDFDSRWLLGLTGVLSIILGALLLANPVPGGAALIWAVGVYATVFGVTLFALGLRMLMSARHDEHERTMHGPAATAT